MAVVPYGFLEALLKIHEGRPAQFLADAGGVDGVAEVVAFAVRHKADLGLAAARWATVQCIVNPAQGADQVEVVLFVVTAYVVGFTAASAVEDNLHGPHMVPHVEPIADIETRPVNGDGPSSGQGPHHHRNQFLGVLAGSVIVGAIAQNHRQTVGMVVGPYKMIRSGFGSRVRGAGVVRRAFVEKALGAQAAVHFVGRYMVKAVAVGVSLLTPSFQSGIEQGDRAYHIGLNEFHGVGDGAVHMAFGSQVQNPVEAVLVKQASDELCIADIPLDQGPIANTLAGSQVGWIARIGQFVQDHNAVLGIMLHPVFHQVGTNKTGSSGDQKMAWGA